MGRLRKRGFLAQRSNGRSEDGTEIRAGEATGRAGCEGDPPRHPAAVFGRGKDPDRADWSARRGQHRRAVPARGDCAEPLLPLVEGISGGGEETPGRRHGAGRDVGRGQGAAPGGQRVEGRGGRADAGEPAAQKKRDWGWGGRRMRYSATEKLECVSSNLT